jgi:hypothetical protein
VAGQQILAAAIDVVNQPLTLDRAPPTDGLFNDIEDEPCMG